MKNTYQVTVADFKTIEDQARAIINQQGSWDCYKYYKLINKLYNEFVQSLTGSSLVSIDTNGNGVLNSDKTSYRPFLPKLMEEVESVSGFTPEEYSKLTGQPVPNQWFNRLVAVDEETGKVHSYAENGNISVMMGHPEFSQTDKYMITKVDTVSPNHELEFV